MSLIQKPLVLLQILLCCNFISGIAQRPSRFEDFPYCPNTDSLEQVLNTQKLDNESRLYGLITLELNRWSRSDKFGLNLDTIKKLAESEQNKLGLAMYQNLYIKNNFTQNLDVAVNNCLKSIEFFEEIQDTLGMIEGYFQMVILNQNLQNDLYGDKATMIKYYDKIIELGEHTNNPNIRLQALFLITLKKHPESEDNQFDKALTAFKEAEKIIANHPKHLYFLSKFYTNIGTRCYFDNKLEELLYFHKKAYELSKNSACNLHFTDVYNLGNAYFFNKNYADAARHYKEAINYFKTCTNGNKQVLASTYEMLSHTMYFQKQYEEAWQIRQISDSLVASNLENLRSTQLLEFQTKYETNKKEADNQRLQLEQINARQKIRFYGIALLTLFLASIVLAWLYQKIKYKNIELSRLNQLIQSQNQHLAEANLQMEQFTYALSHDAISYINHIINLTTVAKDTESLSFAQGIIQKINRNATNLKKMAQNLIRINKMKQAQPRQDNIALDDLVAEVLEDVEEELSAAKTQTILGKLPHVEADHEMLKQVFHNLIGNALKFKNPDMPLELGIFAQNNGNGFVEIRVCDNGMGIPEEKQPYIFQEFVKGDRQKEGSGLGLFISKRIVEDLGGTIYVESTEGVGTQFIFTLPYASEAEE